MSETTQDSTQPVPEAPVERYELEGHSFVKSDPKGSWVRYEDYEKLLRWKQEQLAVTPDWQEIGREMGLQIGESVHDKILPWIREAKSMLGLQLDVIRAELARLEPK